MQDLPVGFRFYPTEEELVSFYLRNKLQGNREDQLHLVIPCINVYSVEPWHLPSLSTAVCKGSTDWFFFTPRQEREAQGGRPIRTTANGYWKATGCPSNVISTDNRVIGVRKSMVFYKGRPPTVRKTKWKMNEYIAIDERQQEQEATTSSSTTATPKLRQEFRLCRLYVGSGAARAFDRRPCEAPARAISGGQVLDGPSTSDQQEVSDHLAAAADTNNDQEDDPLLNWDQLNWVCDADPE